MRPAAAAAVSAWVNENRSRSQASSPDSIENASPSATGARKMDGLPARAKNRMAAGAGGRRAGNGPAARLGSAEWGEGASAKLLSAPAQRTVNATWRFYGKLRDADASPL